ncbi:MAG: hypothetical protein JRJ03_00365 [Deltaproteobacteria bacterium]|nr:hypothetical protein [Deltaproteobacteria bacterium]
MDKAYFTREQVSFICQRLSEILPECFRLHSKLLQVADPATREIVCSLDELAKKLDYDPYVLYYWLTGLDAVKFVTLPSVHEFSKKTRIEILVRY